MIPFEDATTLSLLFHLNSEPWQNTEAYESATYEIEYQQVAACAPELLLPNPAESPLRSVLKKRASCRAYDPKPLSFAAVASLLSGAYGVVRVDREILDGAAALLRTVPSAGGLFPLELYLTTQRVEGVPDGLHHYNVRNHSLEPLEIGPVLERLGPSLYMFPLIQNASLVVFLVGVFERMQKKYGPRGYRYILLEAGHVAQNLCLLAVELGLGSLCMGGYADLGLNRRLGLDERAEGVVYSVAIGWPHTPPHADGGGVG